MIVKLSYKSVQKKNELFHFSKSNPTLSNIEAYKSYKNKLTSMMRKVEMDYYCYELEITKSIQENLGT